MSANLRQKTQQLENKIKALTGENEKLKEQLKTLQQNVTESETHKLQFLYESIIQNMTEGIAVQDSEGYFSFVNPAAARIVGYEIDEMIGMHWKIIIPPDQQPIVEEADQRRAQGFSDRYELELRHKNGTRVPVQVSGSPRKSEDKDKFIGTLAVFTDITESKQAQQALENNERFLKDILNAIQDGISVLDKDLNIVRVNHAMEKWYPDVLPLEGKKCYQVYQNKEEVCSFCPSVKVLADEQPHMSIVPIINRDEKVGWAELHASPVFDHHDQMIAIVEYVRDITDRKHAELELSMKEERFRSLTETTSDWIWEIDLEAVFTYCSPKVTDLLGYAPDELLGKTPFEFMPPEEAERVSSFYREKVAAQSSFSNLENTKIHKNGQLVVIETSGVPFFDADGALSGYRGINRDITERKRVEDAIRESEVKFRNIVESSPMGMHMYQLEPDGNLIFVDANPAADQILGVSNQQFVGKTIEEAFPALAQTEIPARYRQAAREGIPWKTDQITYEENKISGAFDVRAFQTSPGKMVAMFLDITARKQAEEALLESQERLSLAVNGTGVGLWDWKVQTGEAVFNERWANIIGYTLEELAPVDINTWIKHTHPEDLEKSDQLLQAHFSGQTSRYECEVRMKHKNGEWIWVLDRGQVVEWDAEKKPIRMAGTHLEITKRKQAEEALKESERNLKEAQSLAKIGHYNFNVANLSWTCSEGLDKIFGIGPDFEKTVSSWLDIVHPEHRDLMADYFENYVLGRGRKFDKEYQIITVDTQTEKWVRGIGNLDFDDQGNPVRMFGTIQDISEQKRANERIQRQLQRLDALRRIDMAIGSNFELQVTLSVVLEQTLKNLDIDAADVLLLNDDQRVLEFVAGRGFHNRVVQQTRLNLGYNLASRAVLSRQIVAVPNKNTAKKTFLDDPAFIEDNFEAYFSAPLIVKGEVKGVLEVFKRQPINPPSGWIDFLEALAGQAAIAIENAQLFDSLEKSNIELSQAYENTLEGWAHALELRDYETRGHSQRVTDMTLEMAHKMGVSEDQQIHIRRGALLHDVGKLAIPDKILRKPGPLTDEEWQIMRQHPVYAYEMLSTIEYLLPALDIPYSHHEKWDGSGYPLGLRGTNIPIAARIFSIIDVWDALLSDRSYRSAWPKNKVLAYLREQSGSHFDPQVVDVFFSLFNNT